MLKKVILAAALAVSATFAAWDYYPVLEAGKGSVKGGLYYDWDHDWSQAGLELGVRYTLIQNLELSLQGWGYQFWSEVDCKDCVNGGDGMRDLAIGVRYQFDPMVNAFIDFHLPVGSSEVTNEEISFYAGAQFSMAVASVPGLKFGAEGAIDWGFEHDNYERGLDLHLSGEVGYTVPNVGITPFVGLKIKYRLTESEVEWDDGKEHGQNDDGDKHISIWLGADYFVIPNQLDLVAKLIVRSGSQLLGGDATGLYVGCEFFF